jgi:hypothetical protein
MVKAWKTSSKIPQFLKINFCSNVAYACFLLGDNFTPRVDNDTVSPG